MKNLFIALLISTPTLACGSTPALKVSSPTTGSVVDRLIAMQESFTALIGGSKTSDEAAAKIDAYCTENADAIARTLADQEAAMDDTAMRDEFIKRSEKLVAQADKLYGDRPELMSDGKVEEAMGRCRAEE